MGLCSVIRRIHVATCAVASPLPAYERRTLLLCHQPTCDAAKAKHFLKTPLPTHSEASYGLCYCAEQSGRTAFAVQIVEATPKCRCQIGAHHDAYTGSKNEFKVT